jgi:hypothetical protein
MRMTLGTKIVVAWEAVSGRTVRRRHLSLERPRERMEPAEADDSDEKA